MARKYIRYDDLMDITESISKCPDVEKLLLARFGVQDLMDLTLLVLPNVKAFIEEIKKERHLL